MRLVASLAGAAIGVLAVLGAARFWYRQGRASGFADGYEYAERELWGEGFKHGVRAAMRAVCGRDTTVLIEIGDDDEAPAAEGKPN